MQCVCVCGFSWVASARNNNSNKKERGYCVLCQHNTHANDAHGKIVLTWYIAAPSQHLCTKVGCSMVNRRFAGEGIWNNYMVAVPLFIFSAFLTTCLFLLLFCSLFSCQLFRGGRCPHLFSGWCMHHASFLFLCFWALSIWSPLVDLFGKISSGVEQRQKLRSPQLRIQSYQVWLF